MLHSISVAMFHNTAAACVVPDSASYSMPHFIAAICRIAASRYSLSGLPPNVQLG